MITLLTSAIAVLCSGPRRPALSSQRRRRRRRHSIAAGCTTYGHPSDLDFFGSDGAGLQVLGGNAACGYSGGWTNMTSTGSTAPLLNSASLAPTVLGNPGYAE